MECDQVSKLRKWIMDSQNCHRMLAWAG